MDYKRLLTISMIAASVTTMQAQSFETAQEAVTNMGVGWNLGNTLEAHAKKPNPDIDSYWGQEGLESENDWGQPNTKPEVFKMMKEAGFGAIRIPVTWYNHMDKDGNVNAEWMARVKQVVDYALAEGLYCIINVHHDTGADEAGAHVSWIKAEGANYEKNKSKFEKLWLQIATKFKDYDQKLLFESYNEMLDKFSSWNYATSNKSGGYNETEAMDAYKAINDYAQSFVNVVRGTEGNNGVRNLVVNTYGACCGGKWGSNELPMGPIREMKLPDDVTSNHLIFQIHSYPGLKPNNLAAIKTQVTTMMSDLKTILAAKGAPVIVGEWGTLNDDSDVNYNNNKANYLEFCKHFVTEAKNNGIITFYWMGLSDGSNRSLPVFHQPDLAETIVKAYRGSTEGYKYPVRSDIIGDIVTVVDFKQQWSEVYLYNKTINTNTYKAIELELDAAPESGVLKFKVYKSNGDGVNVDITSAKSKMTFTSAMGNNLQKVTLQCFSNTYQTKVKSAYLVKNDDTKEQLYLTPFWGCSVDETVITAINPIVYGKTNDDNHQIYNLQGLRVGNPQRGIYIKNGKKYIAK
jgi:aryl-phospho-beta-D-glucosidase BglC (GH1 family)